jgi:hypothetical protein
MKATAAVLDYLESRGVVAALVGGVALGAHGIARATLDTDILVASAAVLDARFWADVGTLPPPDIRPGDPDDPLLGLARFDLADGPVDVIAISGAWIRGILERRLFIHVRGRSLPVVDRADLVLLKLYAGGPQDLLDIQLLLEADTGELRPQVETRLAQAPAPLRAAWAKLNPA